MKNKTFGVWVPIYSQDILIGIDVSIVNKI